MKDLALAPSFENKTVDDDDPTLSAGDFRPDLIEKPSERDVLIGRGGLTLNHPGNVEFRRLVQDRKPTYLSAKRPVKHLVATEIVQSVQEKGGRFVKRRRDGWYEVIDKIAQSKTMHALRDKKQPLLRGPDYGAAGFAIAGDGGGIGALPPMSQQAETDVVVADGDVMGGTPMELATVSNLTSWRALGAGVTGNSLPDDGIPQLPPMNLSGSVEDAARFVKVNEQGGAPPSLSVGDAVLQEHRQRTMAGSQQKANTTAAPSSSQGDDNSDEGKHSPLDLLAEQAARERAAYKNGRGQQVTNSYVV